MEILTKFKHAKFDTHLENSNHSKKKMYIYIYIYIYMYRQILTLLTDFTGKLHVLLSVVK